MGVVRHRRLVRQTVDEAIAIVNGSVLEEAYAARSVPPWARLSRLAHSTWDDLAGLAGRQRFGTTWEAASSYLAADLLCRAGDPERLQTLQRNCLIPLELDLLAGAVKPALTPRQLVRMVGGRIERGIRVTDTPPAEDRPTRLDADHSGTI